MAKFMNLLSGQGKEGKEVLASLNLLDKHKVAVRMEVESANIHFNTRISIKSATVVIAKPLNLKVGLSKGGTVRFKVPDSEGKEVRMEVLTPHFNLTNGNPVFLCKIPKSFAQSNMRGASRFNTSRFTNVKLVLDKYPDSFRIVDLSLSGCNIFLPNKDALTGFNIGQPIGGARIHLGNKVSVKLASITPRNLRGQALGCQFTVDNEGPAKKYLLHLLGSLERAEVDRYRT